jgi:copper chaperone CopZ
MRNSNLVSISFVVLSMTLAACNGERGAPPVEVGTSNAAANTAAVDSTAATAPVAFTITVKGMHCEGCEGAICDKVGKIAGVTAVKASHIDETVDVTAPAESRGDIVAAIKKLGYKIED